MEALCDRLLDIYLDEMAVFLWDESQVRATNSSIRRVLSRKGWSNKTEFRSYHLSYHLVYMDESGCDKRIGFRQMGWSPLGVAPVQISKFHRDHHYQILPAYAQDDIILSCVFQGSTDASVFEDFIEQLLQHCGKWPEPKSGLVTNG